MIGGPGEGSAPGRAAPGDPQDVGDLERREPRDLDDHAPPDRQLERLDAGGPSGCASTTSASSVVRVVGSLGSARRGSSGHVAALGSAAPARAGRPARRVAASAAAASRWASSRSASAMSAGTPVRAVLAATAQANPTIRRRARPWVMITAPFTPEERRAAGALVVEDLPDPPDARAQQQVRQPAPDAAPELGPPQVEDERRQALEELDHDVAGRPHR